MTRTRTALAVAAMLLLAGCGGATEAAESTTPTASATGPSPGALSSAPVAQRYESVEALRDALGAGGYYCTDWQRDDRVALALQSGQCSDADVLMIFTGESAVHEAAQNLKALVSTFVVGENWIVNTDRPYAVTYAIGGTVVEGDLGSEDDYAADDSDDPTARAQDAAGEHVVEATEDYPGEWVIRTDLTDPRGADGSDEAKTALAICEALQDELDATNVRIEESDGTTLVALGGAHEECTEV